MAEKVGKDKTVEKEGEKEKVEKVGGKEGVGKTGSNNALAAVAYLLTVITGAIIYLTADKEDKYVRFHAIQAILYGLAMTIFVVILVVIDFVVVIVLNIATGFLGCCCGSGFWVLIIIIIFVPTIFLIYQAYVGNKFKIPVLGDLAEKYA